MPIQTWRGNDFSMKPVDPGALTNNPVVRTLNMEMRGDGLVAKRLAAESGSLPSGTINHITHDIHGVATLIVKRTSGAVAFTTDGSGFTNLSAPSNDPPISSGGFSKANERGSFVVHGRDIYYADPTTIFAWDGGPGETGISNTVRRPGVVSMDGLVYNEPTPGGHPAGSVSGGLAIGNFGRPDEEYGPPMTQVIEDYPGLCDPLVTNKCLLDCTVFDPCIIIPFTPQTVPPTGFNPTDVGEKTLNTGFALSYYDPIRDIFGRRTDVFALPYLFSAKHVDGSTTPATILSRTRTQYAKIVSTPGPPTGHGDSSGGNDGYKVAIWFTRGLLPAAETILAVSGGWWATTFGAPAMSKRMNETLFLEGIFDAGQTSDGSGGSLGSGVICKKGDTALFESARYLDSYARPVPCKHMTILPTGVAIYFFPKVVPTRFIAQAADINVSAYNALPLGSYAEYSVKHPEQIARNTDKQNDTRSPIPNLRGTPLATIVDGMNNLLLTNLGLYRVGFSRGVVLSEVTGGRGVRSVNSIHVSSIGLFYMADEGVVWLRGGQSTLLDQKLGFGLWFERMLRSQKEAVTVGVNETRNQIMVFHNVARNTGNSGARALVYDYERNFSAEWRGSDIPSTPPYTAYFRSGTDQTGLFTTTSRFGGGVSPVSSQSLIELWLNQEAEKTKRLGFIEITLGVTTGNITITCIAHDHPDQAYEPVGSGGLGRVTRTEVLGETDPTQHTRGRKFRIGVFQGMRGRMFHFTIDAGSSTNWSIQEFRVEWEVDEQESMRDV